MKKTLVFLFCFPLFVFAESKIIDKDVRFTASHQFKKINGKIDSIKVSPFQVKKSGESFLVEPFSIQILLQDMKTGDSNRDNHMMEALGFPEVKDITLEILKVQYSAGKYQISFNTKMNGIKKLLTSTADTQELDGKLKVSGKFLIKLDQFNVTPPSLLFIKISNEVICEYNFTLSEN